MQVEDLVRLLKGDQTDPNGEQHFSTIRPLSFPTRNSPYVDRKRRLARNNIRAVKQYFNQDMIEEITGNQVERAEREGLYPKVLTNTNPGRTALPTERFPGFSPSMDQGGSNQQRSLYRPRGSQLAPTGLLPDEYFEDMYRTNTPPRKKRVRMSGYDGPLYQAFMDTRMTPDERMESYQAILSDKASSQQMQPQIRNIHVGQQPAAGRSF